MGLVSKNNTFTAGTSILAVEHNENFDTIYNEFNGNITNDNIASNAAIADTKLAQITSSGKIAGNALVSILQSVYPVGSIYVNASDATNPGTLLGFGTWSAFGAGRVMVGFDSTDTDFDAAMETGGSKTFDNSHDHGGVTGGVNLGTGGGDNTAGTLDTQHNHDISSAGSATQSLLQPYITCYFWRRTA